MEKKIKEIDIEGHTTLNVVGNADKFNEWIYQTIKVVQKQQ